MCKGRQDDSNGKVSSRNYSRNSNLAKKMNEALERLERSDDEADSQDLFNRPPSFEEYMKQIKQCDNLLDALRIRDVINTEIMRKKGEIGNLHHSRLMHPHSWLWKR